MRARRAIAAPSSPPPAPPTRLPIARSCKLRGSLDAANDWCLLAQTPRATQTKCGSSPSLADLLGLFSSYVCVSYDQENEDVNLQRQTRNSNIAKALPTRKRAAATSSKRDARQQSDAKKQRTRAAASPSSTAANTPMSEQETPPSFAFTQGKQSFRKRSEQRKLHLKKQQQCDQQRLDELVEYFKSVDTKQLSFAST
ncbi:hypothetical protein PybrP1_003458 [[Pythium] brassicae (nom. inval.)]|nr:hypothetical protein PybrP1_003458 [[Pythium] brassicae (nom. inval.)]